MDDFSRLSDDLLVRILSFLPTDEAVATSVLSTRWRYLWKLTHRIFISFELEGAEEDNEEERLQTVNSVLSSFDDPISFPVEEISIEDENIYSDVAPIERWIRFALDYHDVKVLNLWLVTWEHKCRFPPPSSKARNYKLMHLDLDYCTLRPSFEGFRNLRSMSLYSCLVTDSAFVSIDQNCTSLESLNLSDVYGLENLRISSNLCRLNHLEIIWCLRLKLLMIDSPNLAFLKYVGEIPAAGNRIRAPRLKEAVLHCESEEGASPLALIQSITGEIEKLSLQLKLQIEQLTDLSRSCPLNNVKELTLRVVSKNLTALDALLRASLSLKSLEISLLFSQDDVLVVPLAGLKHQNLHKIRITQFSCTPDYLQLLRYLIEVAVPLDKLEVTVKGNADGVSRAKEYIEEGIEDKLPYGAKLVILRHHG